MIDIEADGITNPKNIWLVVCKDLDKGEYHVFRNPTSDTNAKRSLQVLLDGCTLLVGHNLLSYDLFHIERLLEIKFDHTKTIDTLIVSQMADYSRDDGHSVAAYGLHFGLEKIEFQDFTRYSEEMERYCRRDVDITERIYNHWLSYITSNVTAIRLEHTFQWKVVNVLHTNGFHFNKVKAEKLLEKVQEDLNALDIDINKQFPPRLRPIREINPRLTKHGTLNRADFRWARDGDLSEYSADAPFTLCRWEQFNAASHKQVIEVLLAANWQPTDKTQTHIETEREINRIKFRPRDLELDTKYKSLILKIEQLQKYGWKINETNLGTLPPSAPAPARSLAKRILLESRRRTLTEWLGLVSPGTGRIHGSFYGIGAWTQRMAHQKPNTANIPNATKMDGSTKLLGKEMRALWCAPRNRLLVGVDAEGIQLRIFAHYIDDKEFTQALINGKKSDKTDPHSLNQRILGKACKTRDAAKRFIFALLLGAGIGKLAQVLECGKEEAQEALDRLIKRYSGFDYLKREVVPSDAKRGYFIGLDGRRVSIPGDTVGERKHLCMSGYLQNGEAVVMKMATLKWIDELPKQNAKLVNFVHDEWQTECPNNMEVALQIADMQSKSLEKVGKELKLKCPLAGSYSNDKDYTIGTNWSVTH